MAERRIGQQAFRCRPKRSKRTIARCGRSGLANAKCQVHLVAIAYNIKRYWRMQMA